MNIRSQSAKPSLSALPNSRNIKSAVPKTLQTQSRMHSSTTRIVSAQKSIGSKSIATELYEVVPKEIIFEDIVPFVKYDKVITIRNLTKQPCRIRVTQPKTSKFRVDFDMQQGIAAGLAMKVLVMFTCTSLEDFKDQIQIQSDEFQTIVHLSALKPYPSYKFEKFLDFGFVQQGTTLTRQFKVSNLKFTEGKVQFKSELNHLKISPNLISIPGKESQFVTISYKAIEMGTFRTSIDVVHEKGIQKIDVAATSVDYSRFLMDLKGSQLTVIDFGEFYIGKSKSMMVKYLNNSPIGYNYKIQTRKGLHSATEETINLQTPNELGVEQCERVVVTKPNEGFIQSYSEVEVDIICTASLTAKEQLKCRQFCFSEAIPEIKEYKYSIIIKQPDEDLIVHVIAKAILPMVRISKAQLNFGECEVNDNKDILFTLQNIQTQPIEVSFSKISNFFLKPEKCTIVGLGQTTIQMTFAPKNVGKYNQTIELTLNDYLKIPIKALGEVNKIARKRPQTRGPEARTEDFQIDPKFINTEKLEYIKKRNTDLIDIHQKIPNQGIIDGFFLDTMNPPPQKTEQNAVVANNFLAETRNNRLEKQRKLIIQKRVETIQKQMVEEDGAKPPKDYEFEMGLAQETPDQDIDLPYKKEGLYVVKPIFQYEPLQHYEEVVPFKPDALSPVKRILSARPQSHKQVRDIHRELSSEDLKRIQCGPIKLDFGVIYVNTTMYRTFTVKNDLRHAIMCRMLVEKGELKDSFKDPQIIDSGQSGQFQIGVCAQGLGQFKQTMKYILNEREQFEIIIVANVESVKIECSKTTIKFQFTEESLQMSTTETIKLSNNGVGQAKFSMQQVENSKYTVQPAQGVVEANSFIMLSITYTPNKIMKDPIDPESDNIFKQQNPVRQDDEKIVLKVKDGSDIVLKCIGFVSDVKFVSKSVVDLQEVCISTIRISQFHIKNTSRNNGVYKILNEYLPSGLIITPNSGKIAPDDNKEFSVKFESKQARLINTNILIMLRSGRVLRIPFNCNCIIPQVSILQEIFDFGDVTTLGNQAPLQMQITNNSQVEVELLFDLRGEDTNPQASEGVDGLQIRQSENLMKSFVEEVNSDEEEQQNSKNKLIRQNKKYLLKIQGQQTLNFQLHFYPKELKKYQFYLPVELHHYGKLETLNRQIYVKAVQPVFIVEPKSVDFGRKIILTPPEKNKPIIQEILLSNPEYNPITFNIQLDDDKVFSMIPLAGRVDGGQTLRVKAMFNPRYDGQYQKVASIYLSDSKPNQPYMKITLSGMSAKPSIQYDTREILLCPVPLGIESRRIVRIYNDGFENQKLGFKQIEGFTAEFLDGNIFTITKTYLDFIVRFISQTTISISLTLEIVDETQHVYPISISGTADNCSFTHYPYLEAEEQKYQINLEKSPQLVEIQQSSGDESDSNKSHVTFFKNCRKTNLLSNKVLEQKCLHFQKWFTQYVNSSIIHFPNTIVENHQQQIFDLITFFTNKTQFPFRANLEGIKQKQQIHTLIHTQIKELILALKIDGALLNHIRPIYLMQYDDYLLELKQSDFKFAHSSSKLNELQFEYLQKYSYLVLCYQILRIYYLPRITLKVMRTLLPSLYEPPISNIYSPQEMLLFKWIEFQITTYLQKNQRIASYKSFQDGHFLAALALSYIGQGGLKYFSPLGQIVKQLEDNKRNMTLLEKAFQEVGIQTHFQLDDFLQLNSPESLLLIMELFTQLPNFQPKKDSLIFSCTLGSIIVKSIQLTNPTNQTIQYRVKLEGSQDFSIEEDQITIEPAQKLVYNIKFTSRISDEQIAQLTFCNKVGAKNLVTTLVYQLKGIISERVSQKIWTVSSTLYEAKEFQITVANQFTNAEIGTFTISIVINKVPLLIEAPKKKKKALSMAEKKKEVEQEALEKQRLERLSNIEPLPAFFCKQESIRLKRGATYNLPMQFLPTQFHPQKCFIIFQDPAVGEFQYEIHGAVNPPEVLYELKPDMQIFIDQVTACSQHIPFINPTQRQALKLVDQFTIEKRKILLRQNSNSVGSNKPQSVPAEDQVMLVSCEEANSYINADKQLTLLNYNQIVMNQTRNSEDEQEQKQQKTDETQNRLNFTMNFKTAVKDYMAHFMLINETKTDVRRIRVQVTSLPKPIKAILEMVAPSRETISQDIPIVNNTDRDFNLKVTLTGDPRFQIQMIGDNKKKSQKEQIIKKRTNGAVTVVFAPEWICEVEGLLQVYNPLTNDVYEYTLKGKGEEPLSEGHFTIKAIARQPIKQMVKIDNPYEYELRYSVETDLLNAAGESEIIIQPQTTYEYQLLINPVISGQFTGQITFTGNGHYRWWTLTLNTDTPKSLGIVDLVSPIRKAIAFDIEIANPLPENITYEVVIEGEQLTGDPWFSVLPGGSSVYQLVFQPLVEGRWKGSVAFLHPKMGEIWYQLNLIGEDRGGVRVPQFKTELGKQEKFEVLLENPTGKPIYPEIYISNQSNFSLEYEGAQLLLEPYTLKPIYIVFVPSALSAHSGEISIRTTEIGKWLFLCFGTGETPTPFAKTIVIGKKDQAITQQIEFKNPLKEALFVQLRLEQEKEGFELLLKKNRISIAPQSSLLIPYQFLAKEIAQYNCNLILEMNSHVKWTYPLEGQTENEVTNMVHLIQTKCRIPLKQKLCLKLDGLKAAAKVMYKIVDHERLGKELKINLPNHKIMDENQLLEFDIVFHPMKPFKLKSELHVKIESGGVWKFKLQINALEPQVDDVIVITSDINQLSKVQFKLTNRVEEFVNFKAYFTAESNNEFSVEPTNGMLEPFGKNGTEFKVGFRPKEYGKRKEAKLIIETEQMFWSYILKGQLPKYIPPGSQKANIDDQQKLQLLHNNNKNFVVENIKIPRVSPPRHNN